MWISEQTLEKKVISFLKQQQFVYKTNDEIDALRDYEHSEVVLKSNLRTAIKRINKDIDESSLGKVIFEINKLYRSVRVDTLTSLYRANQIAHDFLTNGIKIEHIDRKTETIKLVDFGDLQNNELIVTNQFKMHSGHHLYDRQIPDVVVYLNGLPVIVMELKNPSNEDDEIIAKAYQQLQNYHKFLPKLFVFNLFNIISNKHINKYGAITSEYERYFFWKPSSNTNILEQDPLDKFLSSLCQKNTILDLLQNYIYFTDTKEIKKIIASYHQYFGVKKAIEKVNKILHSKQTTLGKKGGIFWHTQGSGKSCSMIMLTRNLINIEKTLTTIIVTDRNSLDDQLFRHFANAQTYLGQSIKRIETIKDLKLKLTNCCQNGIYLSTIQKFTAEIGSLSDRADILIISDEAHRSHRDINFEDFKVKQKKEKIEKTAVFARNLRNCFKNATFVGFTATPIMDNDRATTHVFGDYIHQYRLDEAVEDGFVVDINFEARQERLRLDEEKLHKLDVADEQIANSLGTKKSYLMEEYRKKLHRIVATTERIVGDNDRVRAISEDFIQHYEQRKNLLKGKALFVAFNRQIALKYRNQILELAPHLKDKLFVVMSTNEQSDKEFLYNKIKREEIIEQFRKVDSKVKILIVVYMLLTGFDVPCLDTMYIDRPIKKHNLMQAIARVNRVYTDSNNSQICKQNGLIVDYIGIWNNLKKAFQQYSTKGSFLTGGDIINFKEQALQLIAKIHKKFFAEYLTDLNILDVNDGAYLYQLSEKMQSSLYKKKQVSVYFQDTKHLKRYFAAVLSILTPHQKYQLQFLILIRNQLIQREIGNFEFLEIDKQKLKDLIEEAIMHNKINVIAPITGGKMPFNSITTFLTDCAQKNINSHLEAERGIKLTDNLIKELERQNRVRGKQLSEKLKALVDKYHKNFDDTNEEEVHDFFLQLKKIAQETQEISAKDKELNLTTPQLAFYAIISDDKYSQSEYDTKKIREITLEVFNKVKKKINKAWLHNKRHRKLVEAEISETLIKYRYPPKNWKKLKTQLIFQLTDHIDDNLISLNDKITQEQNNYG